MYLPMFPAISALSHLYGWLPYPIPSGMVSFAV